jgi:hypothetical protein
MGSLVIVDFIESINLFLKLGKAASQGLLVQPPEQGLMQPFVFALGSWFIRFSRDSFDPKPSHILFMSTSVSAPRRVQG